MLSFRTIVVWIYHNLLFYDLSISIRIYMIALITYFLLTSICNEVGSRFRLANSTSLAGICKHLGERELGGPSGSGSRSNSLLPKHSN